MFSGAGLSVMSGESESLILASKVKGKKPACARTALWQLRLPSEATEDAGFIQQRSRPDGEDGAARGGSRARRGEVEPRGS